MFLRPEQFVTDSLRKLLRAEDISHILTAAIHSADAGAAVHNHISLDSDRLTIADKDYDLSQFKRVFVIGAGKAALPMAKALHEILGSRITAGIVITKKGYLAGEGNLTKIPISIFEASHPVPDQSNREASSKVVSLIQQLESNDLVIFLLSGGGSALFMKPMTGISLRELQVTTKLLLSCGADIGEINTIRKHLDDFKGGGLAKLISPAPVLSLIISDVVGDHLDMIASGPTVADPTTFQDAWSILNKYQLWDQIPSTIRSHFLDGIEGKIPETLKPGDPILDRVQNVIVGNNAQSVVAAERSAYSFGFNTQILTISLQGEASEAGRLFAQCAISLLSEPSKIRSPACLIAGGETTVTIKGNGKGGRNQEFTLGAVRNLSGDRQLVLVSLATDGDDGPTDAAGAVATNQTYTQGLSMGLDPDLYLANNDSYHYFEHLGDLIKTGPTLTNVNDLVFFFAL